MDESADDAAIVLVLRPGVDHRRCDSIAAHRSSLSRKLSDTDEALLTDLNHEEFQLSWVQSLIGT